MGARIPADADIATLPTISFVLLLVKLEMQTSSRICRKHAKVFGFFYLVHLSRSCLKQHSPGLALRARFHDPLLWPRSCDRMIVGVILMGSCRKTFIPCNRCLTRIEIGTNPLAPPRLVLSRAKGTFYETLKVARAELQDRDPKFAQS